MTQTQTLDQNTDQHPKPPTLLHASCDGFSSTVDAMVARLDDQPTFLFLSLIGTQTAAKTLTAILMSDLPNNLLLQELDPESEHALPKGQVHALPRDQDAPWQRRHRQLPLSRAWHTIMWDRRLEPDYQSKDFILISAIEHDTPAAQHLAFLRRRLKVPIHPNWAQWAWTRALERSEATALSGTNLNAWYCLPDPDNLKEDITQAVKTGLLTT